MRLKKSYSLNEVEAIIKNGFRALGFSWGEAIEMSRYSRNLLSYDKNAFYLITRFSSFLDSSNIKNPSKKLLHPEIIKTEKKGVLTLSPANLHVSYPLHPLRIGIFLIDFNYKLCKISKIVIKNIVYPYLIIGWLLVLAKKNSTSYLVSFRSNLSLSKNTSNNQVNKILISEKWINKILLGNNFNSRKSKDFQEVTITQIFSKSLGKLSSLMLGKKLETSYEGIPISSQEWNYWKNLYKRLLVPESEESKREAG